MVPTHLRAAVCVRPMTPQTCGARLPARDRLSIPSDYESLNLARLRGGRRCGATLVLNGRCPAFGRATPFVDGENCHLFDGSVEGLAQGIFERAW